eukprot:414291-Prymnesium_polylepis.1
MCVGRRAQRLHSDVCETRLRTITNCSLVNALLVNCGWGRQIVDRLWGGAVQYETRGNEYLLSVVHLNVACNVPAPMAEMAHRFAHLLAIGRLGCPALGVPQDAFGETVRAAAHPQDLAVRKHLGAAVNISPTICTRETAE